MAEGPDRAPPAQLAAAPDAGPVVCPACGAALDPGDEFCPECGVELPAGREVRHRRRLLEGAVVAALVVAVGAAGTFGVLWRNEASDAEAARSSLAAVSEQATEATRLTKELAETRERLAQVERLAAVRGDVIAHTGEAVKQVDPLLASVDELQLVTKGIQQSRNRFADDAVDVVDALLEFATAFLEAQVSGEALDQAWVDGRVDEINAQLDALQRRFDALEAADAAYGRASGRFEARADEFTTVIRALRQQLQAVLSG